MRKLLTVMSILMILSIPGLAFAVEPDDYINLKIGWFFPNSSSNGLKDFKQTPVYEFDYGKHIGRYFAAELGGTYYSTTSDEISDYTAAFYGPLATIKVRMHPVREMELFLGAGAGYYWGTQAFESRKTTGTGVGWHIILGGGYSVIDSLALGLDVKYSQAKLKSSDWTDDIEYGGTAASFYLKYMF
jgi:hypothetical protein